MLGNKFMMAGVRCVTFGAGWKRRHHDAEEPFVRLADLLKHDGSTLGYNDLTLDLTLKAKPSYPRVATPCSRVVLMCSRG